VIDLGRTRADLLAEIQASQRLADPVSDITALGVVSDDAYACLRGHTREALFPVLKLALSERFAAVPRPTLIRDLLMPLKHALGNAYKHGNGRDATKLLTVEVVLAARGALIAVTDEGDGFDVDLTVERMHAQQAYFVHAGSGFRGLHRALSPVTWENGGRTLLLCFRPRSSESGAELRQPPRGHVGCLEENRVTDSALHRLVDPAWMRTCLARELPMFHEGRASLESCRAYVGGGPAGDDCGIRYLLRVEDAQTRILTGRLHEEEAAAAADFDAAFALHAGRGWKGLRIPQPVARLTGEPRLVLYDFDPWMNLWQYLSYRGNIKAVRSSAERVATALATFHRSQATLPLAEAESVVGRVLRIIAEAQGALERLPGSTDLVSRFGAAMEPFRDRASARRAAPGAPIHGQLGWDRIHYGLDGFFYFYRFETCRISEPGIDLGGFAADLLRFAIARDDLSVYRVCREDLLASYNTQAPRPIGSEELRFHTALAIGERLRDSGAGTRAEAEQLLAALDALGNP